MKLSICIPTFNRPNLIKIALESALRQSNPDFEIVICDNSENDETEKVVSQYPDERIRYHRHKQNVGIAANWNSLINLASGDYLKFLNDDDELLPDCVSTVLDKINIAENEFGQEIGVVTCAAEYLDGDNKISKKKDKENSSSKHTVYYVNALDVPILWCFNAIPLRTPTHMVYNRKVALMLGGFNKKLDYTRDVHLALQIASRKGALIINSKPLVRFRLHAGQDVKNISVQTRIDDQINTKKWALHEIRGMNLEIDENAILGEICLKELLLMIKSMRLMDIAPCLKKWLQYGSISSIYQLVDQNFYRFRNFNTKYIKLNP